MSSFQPGHTISVVNNPQGFSSSPASTGSYWDSGLAPDPGAQRGIPACPCVTTSTPTCPTAPCLCKAALRQGGTHHNPIPSIGQLRLCLLSAPRPIIIARKAQHELAPRKELRQCSDMNFISSWKKTNPQCSGSRERVRLCATPRQVSLTTRYPVIACAAGQGINCSSEPRAILGGCIHRS